MIYIVTAIYAEAQALITYFGLKKDISQGRFQVFGNQEAEICLVISGTGEIAAAVAVADVCRAAGERDFLMNIGICGGIQGEKASLKGSNTFPEEIMDCSERSGEGKAGLCLDGEKGICTKGDIFLCNKIREQATGRTFYPDILYRHGFAEAQIITGGKPYVKEKREEDFFLYDMEAAAVYQAGAYYFGPHQMSFLKVVSDYGDAGKVTPEQVKGLMERNVEKIAEFIVCLRNIGKEDVRTGTFMVQGEVEKLCRDMHCSSTMASTVSQYVRYGMLSGVDIAAVREEMYREGKLPCRDRKEGKLCLEEFKKRLL